MNYYIGVDIGTTASKTVAFGNGGEVLASCSFSYEMHHPQPDRSEQNPNDILDAVVKGIKKIVAELGDAIPVVVSFSAAMHSLIAIDKEGGLLTQCLIWADNRAAGIAGQLKTKLEGQQFYRSTGVPIHAMSPLCKLLWLRDSDPDVFQQAYRFLGIKEYLFYRFFGVVCTDISIASATGLLNGETLQWDDGVLAYIGLDRERLPELVSPDHIIPYKDARVDLPLPENTPFVMGASDGALSNIGAGATEASTMAINIGTSSAARVVVPSFSTDPQMRTFCYHVNEKQFIIGGASNNGAVVLDWMKEDLLQTTEDFDAFFEHAEAAPAGSDGLTMLPFVLGERAPIWNSTAKGVLYGLTTRHSKAHLVRAAMEGVVFSVYSIGKIVIESGAVRVIYATGGFSKSKTWLQILADVFNIKVVVAEAVESTALGAAIVGAEAVGKPINLHHEDTATYEPDAARHQLYKRLFGRYERLYNLLKDEMTNGHEHTDQ